MIISMFDILGPITVGPSSSHTAGAVRLGLACRTILGEEVKRRKSPFMAPLPTLTGAMVPTKR